MDYLGKWQKCLDIIRDNVGDEKFRMWFACAQAIGYENGILQVHLPSQFFLDHYENNFYPIISAALIKVFGSDIRLSYRVNVISGDEKSNVEFKSQPMSRLLSNKTAMGSAPSPETAVGLSEEIKFADFDPQLNPRYNLENYCVGDSNRLAYTIAEYIALHPDRQEFNPFFLYGDVGVGKTHLIQAIGIKIKENYPKAKVLYVTLRRFMNQLATMTIKHKVPDFINWYQHLDVLLLDDLQELSGKKGTMDALYPIFNHLHQNGKKLIFTCDRAPGDLDGITDRLIDRFKWGITEKLPKPDYELRKQILTFKSAKNGLNLTDSIIDLIATHCTGSIRELEGIVMGILTRCITLNCPLSEDLVMEMLNRQIRQPEKKSVNFDMIVEATADHFNLNPNVIYTKSRVRDIADARQVIMYLARKHTNLSSPAIGSRLNRQHATVIHGINTVRDRLTVSKELKRLILDIEKDLECQ